MSTLDEILKSVNKAENIVILTHENPDGDAIGTSCALYKALLSQNKNVELIVPQYPRIFNEIPGIEDAKKEGSRESYDLAISVDCATIKLLNGWSKYFEDANERIVIDHHSSNSMYGDINYVDPSAPACAQVMYILFRYFEWEITRGNWRMPNDWNNHRYRWFPIFGSFKRDI